jgi:hypothetical protein
MLLVFPILLCRIWLCRIWWTAFLVARLPIRGLLGRDGQLDDHLVTAGASRQRPTVATSSNL